PVSFARHPHTRHWHLFWVRDEPGPGFLHRSLRTAPADPRTGALRGEPVRVVDAISNWVGTPYAAFDVASTGLINWRNTTPSLAIWPLRWLDRHGNLVGTIGEPAGHASLALSPDESKLAVLQGFPEQHVWLYNLANGTGARLSSLPGAETPPVWSPDGTAVYYSSETDAGPKLVRQAPSPGS